MAYPAADAHRRPPRQHRLDRPAGDPGLRRRSGAARLRPGRGQRRRRRACARPSASACARSRWPTRPRRTPRAPASPAACWRARRASRNWRAESGADVVLNAVVGAAGLDATLAALEAGIDVALANKESLVAGGPLVREALARSGAQLLPVDSEHSALHQLLAGEEPDAVEALIVTASGGPFRGRSAAELERGHAGAGAAAPDLDDGRAHHDRLGHAHEQGPRDDRGALAVRRARTSASRSSCTRSRSCTRSCGCATARCSRTSDCPTCACRSPTRCAYPRRAARRRAAARPHARALADVRAGRQRDVPLPRAGARRRPRRRPRAVRPERGRRGGRGGVPGRAAAASSTSRRSSSARWRRCSSEPLSAPRAGARGGCGGARDGARGARGRGARLSSLIAIGGLLALVFIHELGHFVAAKAVGMRVTKFYVGFPPAVVKRSFGDTEYGIGADPAGRLRAHRRHGPPARHAICTPAARRSRRPPSAARPDRAGPSHAGARARAHRARRRRRRWQRARRSSGSRRRSRATSS